MNDIARVAGVSLATVDRVLNERPGVRQVTIKRVHKAIKQLGYVRDTAAANLARKRIYRLMFLLPDSGNEFTYALMQQIKSQAATLPLDRTQLRATTADPFDPLEFVRVLDGLNPDETDGVAIFGPETPSVRDAVKRAHDRGIAVVALVSDLPTSARDHFVGIDNIAAGRTAARLMGRFLHGKGTLLVITDSRLSRDHLERRRGFDEVISAEFQHLEVLPSVEGHDDADLISLVLDRVFAEHPELRGIYASAAAHAGVIRYLEKNGMSQRVVLIAHELTPLSRVGLETGTIDALISQNTGHLIRSAVRLLRATADNAPFNETQEHIRIDIYLKDNIAHA